jgi:hypothetical protein
MNDFFYKAAGAVLAPFRYAEREVEHMKEIAKEDIQALVAKAIKLAILTVAGILFLLFLSIMAAALINERTGSDFIGYAIVAGFYFLIAIIVFISKEAGDHKQKEKQEERKASPL